MKKRKFNSFCGVPNPSYIHLGITAQAVSFLKEAYTYTGRDNDMMSDGNKLS